MGGVCTQVAVVSNSGLGNYFEWTSRLSLPWSLRPNCARAERTMIIQLGLPPMAAPDPVSPSASDLIGRGEWPTGGNP
jgi:hypothetical protein